VVVQLVEASLQGAAEQRWSLARRNSCYSSQTVQPWHTRARAKACSKTEPRFLPWLLAQFHGSIRREVPLLLSPT
ncbi:hypothetical protein GBAR_LOCUS20807, partial [Geodia barretti]